MHSYFVDHKACLPLLRSGDSRREFEGLKAHFLLAKEGYYYFKL